MRRRAFREVKVLSLRQPHADNVIYGPKWSENRTWTTRYRGELYIHASRWSGPPVQIPGHGVIGAIIGKVTLVDVVDLDTVAERDERKLVRAVAAKYGLPTRPENLRHARGPVCFILTDPVPLPAPIPALGKLNIWRFRLPAE